MDFNIDFNLVRSQKLLLIPQLKQALEILEMNSQELFTYVEEQLETNPALEAVADDRLPCDDEQGDTDVPAFDETPDTPTLKEHLLLQLNLTALDKNQRMIGEYLIDNTDENGYLSADICEVAAFFNVPASKVNKVLGTVQSFDPPGICARNLKECLLLQLKQMEDVDRYVVWVVENHLDALASDDVAAVAQAAGLDEERVSGIFKTVRTLEPRPGRDFYKNENLRPVVPDVIIRKINNKFEALINEEAFPDIHIAEDYKVYGMEHLNRDTGAYVQSKLNHAVWLIKCMEQRKNIILKIAQNLLEEQAEFFEKGLKYIKFLHTDCFANAMDMHDSILLKGLGGKYLQCRWGTFELKYFFETKELSF